MPSGRLARRHFFIFDFPAASVAGTDKTNTKHNPKGEKDNEGRVINRLWVVNSLVEEKGMGKETFPLEPYREKGKGKEHSRVSLETHSKPARAREEAAPPVHVLVRRGRRGSGRDSRQLLRRCGRPRPVGVVRTRTNIPKKRC